MPPPMIRATLPVKSIVRLPPLVCLWLWSAWEAPSSRRTGRRQARVDPGLPALFPHRTLRSRKEPRGDAPAQRARPSRAQSAKSRKAAGSISAATSVPADAGTWHCAWNAGSDNLWAYQVSPEAHPQEFVELLNTALINVTSFFRGPDNWKSVKTVALPRLLATRPRRTAYTLRGAEMPVEAHSGELKRLTGPRPTCGTGIRSPAPPFPHR